MEAQMAMSDWILEHGDDLQVIGFFGLLAFLIVAERWAPRGGRDRWIERRDGR